MKKKKKFNVKKATLEVIKQYEEALRKLANE